MNIVVKWSKWVESDISTLFEDESIHFTEQETIDRLMVEIGAYKSTSEARRAKRYGLIPKGWTVYKASKKMQIWIWNPTE